MKNDLSFLPSESVLAPQPASSFLTPVRQYKLRAILVMAVVFSALMELTSLLSSGGQLTDLLFILFIAFPVGVLIGVLEVGVFPGFLARKRLPLALLLAALLHLLVLLLFIVLLAGLMQEVIRSAPEYPVLLASFRQADAFMQAMQHPDWSLLRRPDFRQLLLAYGVAMVGAVFLHQMIRLMGPRVFWAFLTGRYFRPVPEDRIFMFLDLKDSTSLAERLGSRQYSRFISDCFHDMGAAILAARGEVYQYVGDEVVITWLARHGLAQARCLHCFFAIEQQFRQRQQQYLDRYGAVPTFKAGLHGGWVTATQVGDIKSEIAYHGDVVNTAARIQAQCNGLGAHFLISGEIRARLGDLSGLVVREVGAVRLRGKADDVDLLEVRTE
ncbi:adenylate/guanylate cyclase domain-containing protein [Hymenobacter terrenus]|uniref:adenylate/guanylate cyclase domain-containing protein n=1 Tax=Hymenobacter terrenus TaxID=1629124 RepID=UPI0006983E31|nr:adenylate/guanylate cyclase domain-containing protein [Hymenobacter terrenus]